jgi:hypothetical protein
MMWIEHAALLIAVIGWICVLIRLADLKWKHDQLAAMYMDAQVEIAKLKASSEERSDSMLCRNQHA